jgi:hypothetical protein
VIAVGSLGATGTMYPACVEGLPCAEGIGRVKPVPSSEFGIGRVNVTSLGAGVGTARTPARARLAAS